MVDDDVAVGHTGYGRHLVAHENDGGIPGEIANYIVEMMFEALVDVAQRLVEHKQFGARYDSATK